MSKLAYLLTVLILGVSLFTPIRIGKAEVANFTVQPQNEHAITLTLRETDSVSGSFVVESEDETGINFFISDQQGKTILVHNNVHKKSFSFIAQATGDYQLHFDNSVSSVSTKTVVLNYKITSYILGMPQEQFLFFIIAAVVVIGIAAYAALTPK